MYLTWEVCDLKQKVLTRLDNRRGGASVNIALNAPRRAECPLSIEDPAFTVAAAVKTVLRVVLNGPAGFALPVFIGRILIPDFESSPDGEQLNLVAVDPLGFNLERALLRKVTGSTWESLKFSGTDQSQIMWKLIEEVGGVAGVGVAKGALPASKVRDRTYPPTKDVASALVQMSEVIEGPDFMLVPTIAGDGTLATFNTYVPQLGTDKSATIRFVHGAAPYTADAFKLSPAGDQLCNRLIAIGAPRPQAEGENAVPVYPGYVAEVPASIAIYGAIEQRVQYEDVVETATLEAHAKGEVAVRALPVDFFDFTTAPEQADEESGDGVPPAFGRDYWIGDTVGIDSYAGAAVDALAPALSLTGRVTDATITENDDGQLQTKVTCAPSKEAGATTGQAITLLIPEGS